MANAFRPLLTAVAYNLLRAYRDMLAGTESETASIETICLRPINIGARVRRTVRRVWVRLAEGLPFRQSLARARLAIRQLHPPPCRADPIAKPSPSRRPGPLCAEFHQKATVSPPRPVTSTKVTRRSAPASPR